MDRYLTIIREEIVKYVINEGIESLGNHANNLNQLLSTIVSLKSTDANGKEQPELEAFLARLTVYITQIIAAVQRCVKKNVLTEDLNQYGINVPRELDAVNPAAWINNFRSGYYNTGNFINSMRGYGNYAAYKNRNQVINRNNINTTIPLSKLLELYDGFLNDYNTIDRKYKVSSTLSSAPGNAIREIGNLKNTFNQLSGINQQNQQNPNTASPQTSNNTSQQSPSPANATQNGQKAPKKPQINYKRYLLMLRNVNTNGHRLNGYMDKIERIPGIDDRMRNALRNILDKSWNLCDNCITAIESNSIYSANAVNGITSLQDLMSLNRNTMNNSEYFYDVYTSYYTYNQHYSGTIDKDFPILASMMASLRSLYDEMKKTGTFTTPSSSSNTIAPKRIR